MKNNSKSAGRTRTFPRCPNVSPAALLTGEVLITTYLYYRQSSR